MIIILGLGNPGKKFEKTRHNLGFMIIDEFKRKNNFPDFKLSKKTQAEISEGIFGEKRIVLVKPHIFMNESGKVAKSLIKMYRLNKTMAKLNESFWLVHDEIDLPLAKTKISIGRGSAGHKGVKSIINNLGTKNFVRFRVGICPKTAKPKNLEKFILQKFNKGEERIIKDGIKKTVKVIEFSLKEGLDKAMTKLNFSPPAT